VAKIDKFSFGCITINGKKYSRDVLIFADGAVKTRKGHFLIVGSHNIKKEEIEELTRGEPETIVIDTGTNSKANLASDACSWAKERNLNLVVQPSHRAVAELNKLIEQKKKSLLLSI